jgi:sugar lactone lactonase YvrE
VRPCGAPHALAALVLAIGCAAPGAIELDRIPEHPIVLIQRSEREAADRAEALADLQKRQTGSQEVGVANLEDLDALYGGDPTLQRRLLQYQGHLAILDPRTGRTRPVDNAPAAARPMGWSPDHARLLLAARWRDQEQLFEWDPASAGVEIVTGGPMQHPSGCLGPGGQLVAEEQSDGLPPRRRLMASPPGGGPLRPITDGPRDLRPACSPTARQIAFVRLDENGTAQIVVMDLDPPGDPHVVANGQQPAFSPDGQWIVYVARTTQGHRIFRVRPDGAGRTPVGYGNTDESHPAVSPDGHYLTYVSVGDDKRERVRVRHFPEGTGDRPLLGDGDGSMPVW